MLQKDQTTELGGLSLSWEITVSELREAVLRTSSFMEVIQERKANIGLIIEI